MKYSLDLLHKGLIVYKYECPGKDSKFLHCNICSVLKKGKLCTDCSTKCLLRTSASVLLQKIVKHDLGTFLLSLWPYPDWISTRHVFFIFLMKSRGLWLRSLVFVLLIRSM